MLARFLDRFSLGGIPLCVVCVVFLGLRYRPPKDAVIEFLLAALASRPTFDRRDLTPCFSSTCE
ncbi:hypothetical protein Ga0061061_1122 [Chelatococcus sambhunathii]|uniref:Uncharacterized protein n=1 Tax=Chelatococcus sambhunathii TaxID=363953 RepID=A0ABM9U8R0_9HYPH|nr:hypothetical protein Ga0061061_1122 [Chelatococcus sambhunathii]